MFTNFLWRDLALLNTFSRYQARQGIYQNLSDYLLSLTKTNYGAIAQLVEHLHGMQGVRSSSLLGSIYQILSNLGGNPPFFFLLSRKLFE